MYRTPISHRMVDLTPHLHGEEITMGKLPTPYVRKVLAKMLSKAGVKKSAKAKKAVRARVVQAKKVTVATKRVSLKKCAAPPRKRGKLKK